MHMFEWFEIKCGCKKGHEKDTWRHINTWPPYQNLSIIQSSKRRMTNYHSRNNEMFSWVPKLIGKWSLPQFGYANHLVVDNSMLDDLGETMVW